MGEIQQESEMLLLLQSISDGILCIDRDYRIIFMNNRLKEWLFITNQDITGSTLWDLVPGQSIRILKKYMDLSWEKNINGDVELLFNGESPQWLECVIHPSHENMLVFIKDITSKKLIEQSILEKQKNLIMLTEAANTMLLKTEPKEILDALFMDLSKHLNLEVYFNYEYDPLNKKLALSNYYGISEAAAKKIEYLNLGEAVCGTVAQRKKRMIMESVDKSDHPKLQLIKNFGLKAYISHPLISCGNLIGVLSFGSSKRSTFDKAEIELISTICDQVAITLERTFLTRELVIKKEVAEKADHAKSVFLSMMTHELRTPLNTMLGYAQILKEDESLSKKQYDKIDTILQEGRNLSSLITKMLELANVERGQYRLSLQSQDVRPLIENSINEVKTQAKEKNIRIQYEFQIQDQEFVVADRGKLGLILKNLLINAIFYNNSNGHVMCRCRSHENQMIIEIIDNGIGIAKDQLERIFEPYYRINNRKYHLDGTGIGLTVSKLLLNQMNGIINVTSEIGKGSCFSILLPLASK